MTWHMFIARNDIQNDLQELIAKSAPGGEFELPKGRSTFIRSISIRQYSITLQGQGPDQTTLSFGEQVQGAQGMLATGEGITIESLAMENTPGDGLVLKNCNIADDSVGFPHVRVGHRQALIPNPVVL